MIDHATMCGFADSEAPLRSRILAMTTPPRAVSIAAIASSVVLGIVLLVGALEIPVPALRVRIEMGQTPTAAAPTEAAVTPAFKPSSTPPQLLNREEVQRAGEAELLKLEAGYFVEANRVGPTNIVMPQRPKFRPVSVQPSLINRQEVGQALAEGYPKELREAGVGGTVTLGLRVGPEGTILERRIENISGHPGLVVAALAATDIMRFDPARNRDQRVPVWVRLPVTFAANP